jgi:hypothetical protein
LTVAVGWADWLGRPGDAGASAGGSAGAGGGEGRCECRCELRIGIGMAALVKGEWGGVSHFTGVSGMGREMMEDT